MKNIFKNWWKSFKRYIMCANYFQKCSWFFCKENCSKITMYVYGNVLWITGLLWTTPAMLMIVCTYQIDLKTCTQTQTKIYTYYKHTDVPVDRQTDTLAHGHIPDDTHTHIQLCIHMQRDKHAYTNTGAHTH